MDSSKGISPPRVPAFAGRTNRPCPIPPDLLERHEIESSHNMGFVTPYPDPTATTQGLRSRGPCLSPDKHGHAHPGCFQHRGHFFCPFQFSRLRLSALVEICSMDSPRGFAAPRACIRGTDEPPLPYPPDLLERHEIELATTWGLSPHTPTPPLRHKVSAPGARVCPQISTATLTPDASNIAGHFFCPFQFSRLRAISLGRDMFYG